MTTNVGGRRGNRKYAQEVKTETLGAEKHFKLRIHSETETGWIITHILCEI